MEYFANIVALKFDAIVGVVNNSGVDIEGVYFNIIEIQQ